MPKYGLSKLLRYGAMRNWPAGFKPASTGSGTFPPWMAEVAPRIELCYFISRWAMVEEVPAMAISKYFLAAVATVFSVPAAASVIVVGSSSARLCYEAADSQLNPTMDDLRRCTSAFQEGLTLDDTVATYVNRGIILARMGDTDRAMQDYDRALRLDPTEAEAYLNKGAALLRRDQSEAALQHFAVALERKTNRPALAHFGLAIANEQMGNVRQAYDNYRRASELAPQWADPATELQRFQVVDR